MGCAVISLRGVGPEHREALGIRGIGRKPRGVSLAWEDDGLAIVNLRDEFVRLRGMMVQVRSGGVPSGASFGHHIPKGRQRRTARRRALRCRRAFFCFSVIFFHS
jgi:hypothetical protein